MKATKLSLISSTILGIKSTGIGPDASVLGTFKTINQDGCPLQEAFDRNKRNLEPSTPLKGW